MLHGCEHASLMIASRADTVIYMLYIVIMQDGNDTKYRHSFEKRNVIPCGCDEKQLETVSGNI